MDQRTQVQLRYWISRVSHLSVANAPLGKQAFYGLCYLNALREVLEEDGFSDQTFLATLISHGEVPALYSRNSRIGDWRSLVPPEQVKKVFEVVSLWLDAQKLTDDYLALLVDCGAELRLFAVGRIGSIGVRLGSDSDSAVQREYDFFRQKRAECFELITGMGKNPVDLAQHLFKLTVESQQYCELQRKAQKSLSVFVRFIEQLYEIFRRLLHCLKSLVGVKCRAVEVVKDDWKHHREDYNRGLHGMCRRLLYLCQQPVGQVPKATHSPDQTEILGIGQSIGGSEISCSVLRTARAATIS
jgi:hypothetical protein